MEIEFDPEKRAKTLQERGLDFADAPRIFEGVFRNLLDSRNHGEERWRTFGWIDGVAVAIVWTLRGENRRIISMRRMHRWEIDLVGVDRP